MTFEDALRAVRAVLEIRLFTVANTPVTLGTLVAALAIVVATFWLSRAVRGGLRRRLAQRGVDESAAGSVASLANYLILLTGFGIMLQTIGVDIGTLFAAGALFAVGLGFAMQNIAQNFVSGLILLTERSIRPGDILSVGGMVVRVVHLGIRATIARTRDGEAVIIPNSTIVSDLVKNFTMEDRVWRLRTVVGVVYSSDMASVRATLERTVQELEWRSQTVEPRVWMKGFGDNSVNFEVGVWIDDPWTSLDALSDLHEAIWWALKNEDITIAFPQLDVHFDDPVKEAIVRLGATEG
jgi:small-conductance mechanosensitive channel